MLTSPRSFDSQFPSGPCAAASHFSPLSRATSDSRVISHSPSAQAAAGARATATAQERTTAIRMCENIRERPGSNYEELIVAGAGLPLNPRKRYVHDWMQRNGTTNA